MKTETGRKAETAAPVYSPHSNHVWPEGVFNDRPVEQLTRASIGAFTLSHLLAADDLMQEEGHDDPDGSPPLSPFTRSGLFQALLVCVGQVQAHTEALQARAAAGGAA